ncbi:transposase [Tardiphaga sp. vice352]|uniref:IS66-like element accessory protein TnpA n=1 Tax=Tardiphaga sp. vice352 TaxID=2592816 RepID=UPI00116247BE|nr:transposase [Tardiphaga sp. vice352]QDM33313.1 transposase [Tardiphaga sp. vice352]
MDTVDSAITKPVRRLEVFTGAGRRRTWSDEDKARIVAEIERRGDSVSSVARQHGLSPQQLFGWRRRVREADAAASGDDLRFVPAVVDATPCDTAAPRQSKTRAHRRDGPFSGTIDVAIDGVTVRINPGAPAATIAAVLQALKAGA